MSKEKITEGEEPEILSDWEKRVDNRLANIEKLLSEALQKGKSKPEKKPTTSLVRSLVKQCLDWFGTFDVNKFIRLAKENDLAGDDAFSDVDLTYIYSVLPDWNGIILEADAYEEAVNKLCKELALSPSRFEEFKTFSNDIFERARRKIEKAPLPSEIEVSETSEEE